jgi:hypothetical protein
MRVLGILLLSLLVSLGAHTQTLFLFGTKVETGSGRTFDLAQTYLFNFEERYIDHRVLIEDGARVTSLITSMEEVTRGKYVIVTVGYIDQYLKQGVLNILLDTEEMVFGFEWGEYFINGSYILN